MQAQPSITAHTAQMPPRTKGFPLLGSLPDLIQKQTEFVFEAWRDYGDIYTLSLGTFEVLVVNHPDYAQHVLRDHARNYSKGGVMWEAIRKLIGNGLATSEGDYWRRQRRMMQPQFHRQYLASLGTLMVEGIEEIILNDFDQLAASGEAFDATQAFAKITMNVIMKTMFGRSIDPEENKRVGDAVAYALRFMVPQMVTGRLPEWVPVPGRKRFQEAQQVVDEFIYRMIDQRRKNPDGSMDMLTMLLNMVDDETSEPMTDEQIRDEVATIFLAGYETTSLAMAWVSYVLTNETAIQDKLHNHVEETLQGQLPRFEDLRTLDYSRMVLSEALRLYPPAFWWSRSAIEEDTIGGYHIKPGQLIAIMVLTLHRHPDFWANPDVFDPERFSPDAEKGRHPLAWMPFGAGQRQCIGKDFAMMEGTLILSRFAQRYRVVSTDKPAPQFAFSSTLSAKDGIWVKIEKR
jgi:cytochrome P450